MLTEMQRRTVQRGAFEFVRKERPSFAVVASFPGLGAIVGFSVICGLMQLLLYRPLVAYLGGAVGGLVGSHFGMLVSYAFMRPYYRRYMEAHRDEIITAGSR